MAAILVVLDQGAGHRGGNPLGSSVSLTPCSTRARAQSGAAFSFRPTRVAGSARLSGIGIVVSLTLAILLWRGVRSRLEAAAYVGLIGGAMGNVIDRLRIGAVVDYLDLYWRDMHWPAFNLADVWVVGSAVLLVLASFEPGMAPAPRGMAMHPEACVDAHDPTMGRPKPTDRRPLSSPTFQLPAHAAEHPNQLGGHSPKTLGAAVPGSSPCSPQRARSSGEVMGTPCVLCWYQRIGMFPLAVILGVGVFVFWGTVAEGSSLGQRARRADADFRWRALSPYPCCH
jgi:signal peptidase II